MGRFPFLNPSHVLDRQDCLEKKPNLDKKPNRKRINTIDESC